ncbi:hypothetical protein GCM10009555_058400 [Acrocarpospora macrocephala]|uniref:Uncharacterized protein n=1 Tax=Acrocarpospora macrocephala TaxID=150177 RepID=A0A5M3WRI4_9ACTN|nr:hypothetical protein [Acrocarpospora macrocephala]GES11935.1 hypothetical protein Amac_055320 [Acrocarpospora macrocephala]
MTERTFETERAPAPPAPEAERRPPAREAERRPPGAGPGDLTRIPVGSPALRSAPAKPAAASGRGGFLQTVSSFLGGLFTHPIDTLRRLFGGEGYTDRELADYLTLLDRTGDIEGDFDSDNKARAVVARWKGARAGFELPGTRMALLMSELLAGATGGDDERAILDLLTRADDGDLRVIFQRVPVARLLKDIGGANGRRLTAWIEARFEGGLPAVRRNAVEPKGGLPPGAPVFPYDWAHFRQKFDGLHPPEQIIQELARLTPDERERAARDLIVERDTLDTKIDDLRVKAGNAPDQATRAALQDQLAALSKRELDMSIVLEDAFKEITLAETPAQFAAKAVALTPAQRAQARQALVPPVPVMGGVPVPFAKTLPGEHLSYEDKLRAAMPAVVDGYWNQMAKERQPADHGDPAKLHTLSEMEDLAKVSKDETDEVFAGHYDKALHPPLKADRPGRRASLHDLWADTQAFLTHPATSFAEKRALAKALVLYFYSADDTVGELNRKHRAVPSFSPAGGPLNDAAVAQDKVARELTTTAAQVRRLNEIDRGWDASANPATQDVNLQLFRPKGGVAADQDFLWDMFQTLIHEYLHTLAHGDYRRFAERFGPGQAQNTLIEGMDSFLDEVVWARIRPRVNDPGLRRKVEGPAYAAQPPIAVRHASRRRYSSFAEATRLVSIVGYRNVILAYFKGEIDKIGG